MTLWAEWWNERSIAMNKADKLTLLRGILVPLFMIFLLVLNIIITKKRAQSW